MSAIDQLINDYAKRAEEIYEKRTAGDSTWQGVLGSFLLEVSKLPHVVIMPEVPKPDVEIEAPHEG